LAAVVNAKHGEASKKLPPQKNSLLFQAELHTPRYQLAMLIFQPLAREQLVSLN
jgi:hypothetical protein